MMKNSFFLIIIFSILVLGCKKALDNTQIVEKFPNVHPDFLPYVEKFIAEAKLRNVIFPNIENLIVEYATLDNPLYCATGGAQVKVRGACWSSLTSKERELLMFHELGHTLLKRLHKNLAFPNGEFKSLMANFDIFIVNIDVSGEKRKYYLDELFNMNPTSPEWINKPYSFYTIFSDSIDTNNQWQYNPSITFQDGIVDKENYSSKPLSLSIQSTYPSNTDYSYWAYRWSPPYTNTPFSNKKLVLKVKTKATKTKATILLALAAPNATEIIDYIPIEPSASFQEYLIGFWYKPNEATNFNIKLGAKIEGTGNVYFDDISIVEY